ncbi:hypothetical protein OAT18_01310 [Tenacibaculum sp.]|nr:hypothetical protein [Tenacibaculum sp.]
MKKLLSILLFFIVNVCFAQKGYWLCKDYRIIDKSKGWGSGCVGLIIDFDNSKTMILERDTIVNIKVDKFNKVISLENFIRKENYSIVNETIEIKEDNIINVFYPFKFKNEIDFSKEKIFNKLISTEIKRIKNYGKFHFTNGESMKTMCNSDIRVLNTTFLDKEKQKSLWFIQKINKNVFLGFNTAWEQHNLNIYRVIGINDKSIDLEPIVENALSLNLKKIEFED